MQISEVQISFIKPQNGLLGFASLVIDGSIYLSSIGVYQKLDGSGFRITYPTKQVFGKDAGVFHPITKEAGRLIEQAILTKLKDVMKGSKNVGHSSFNAR